MRRIRVYKYSHALPHLHDQIKGYENSVPFSEAGIAKWCDLVGPDEAELFYCGQFNDQQRFLLQRDRFEFLVKYPDRHVFDIEGDIGLCYPIHQAFRGSIFSAMNAEPNHRNWNVMVRPGCSMFLKDLLANPRQLKPLHEAKQGFYFRGQMDPNSVRGKMMLAFDAADVPGSCEIIEGWNAPTPADSPIVQRYEAEMTSWTYALCPAGWGQATQRFLEAVLLGRIAVIIGDGLLFGDSHIQQELRLPASVAVEQLARWLRRIYKVPFLLNSFYAQEIRDYFEDPTAYFLSWMYQRGIIEWS
jgi:hypothetical protein